MIRFIPAANGALGSEHEKEHNTQINEDVAELASAAGNCSLAASEETQVALPSAIILKLFFLGKIFFFTFCMDKKCGYMFLLLNYINLNKDAEKINEYISKSIDYIENKQALDWDFIFIF